MFDMLGKMFTPRDSLGEAEQARKQYEDASYQNALAKVNRNVVRDQATEAGYDPEDLMSYYQQQSDTSKDIMGQATKAANQHITGVPMLDGLFNMAGDTMRGVGYAGGSVANTLGLLGSMITGNQDAASQINKRQSDFADYMYGKGDGDISASGIFNGDRRSQQAFGDFLQAASLPITLGNNVVSSIAAGGFRGALPSMAIESGANIMQGLGQAASRGQDYGAGDVLADAILAIAPDLGSAGLKKLGGVASTLTPKNTFQKALNSGAQWLGSDSGMGAATRFGLTQGIPIAAYMAMLANQNQQANQELSDEELQAYLLQMLGGY